jgi:hypothetical protein
MADYTTLIDIARLNGNDDVVGLIEDNVKYAPEAMVFPFRTIRGTSYKTVIRTALPDVAFRSANDGQTPTKSTFRDQLTQCYIFGGLCQMDVAVADADERGAEHLLAIEASGVMQRALRKLGSQVWYGTSTDSKGFPGLKAFTTVGASTLAGDPLTVDATGTTANTASSVYAVRFGDQDVQMIGGNNASFTLDPWTKQVLTAPSGSGQLLQYVATLNSWLGLSTQSENSVRRIYNLTAETGKGMTDALATKLLYTFPAGYRPDAIFCSRRSMQQWQTSRSVTLFGNGSNRPNQPITAPYFTDFEGIPIYVTDSILDTDAIGS